MIPINYLTKRKWKKKKKFLYINRAKKVIVEIDNYMYTLGISSSDKSSYNLMKKAKLPLMPPKLRVKPRQMKRKIVEIQRKRHRRRHREQKAKLSHQDSNFV